MTPVNEFLEDIFHSCALLAYVEVMEETGQNPPDSELTRQRAYRYFENYKREINAQKAIAV